MTKRKKRGPDAGKVQYDPTELERARLHEEAAKQREAEASAPQGNRLNGGERITSSRFYPSKSLEFERLVEAEVMTGISSGASPNS